MDLTETDLRAAIKALSDVVAPAVDPKDALATEQLRLVVEYLRFLRQRVDLLHQRDRTELQHQLEMARALRKLEAPCSDGLRAALQGASEVGEQRFNDAAATGAQLKAACAALAAAVRDGTREANDWPAPARDRWERCVLYASAARVAFEQAWYLPLGFEPAPAEVPALDSLLARPA
ncbi:MAG TPA: hypothetical protein VLJ19_11540 [Variovorax sp.]|nr:hypothetical protein [Variovorax sp.]